MSHAMVLVTCPDEDSARTLARALVEAKLAACAQLSPITSIYRWENQVEEETEIRLILKTRAALFPRIQTFISDHHPYEVAQIIQLPIQDGLPEYLGWMDENTLSD